MPGSFATPAVIIKCVLLNVSVAPQGTIHVQSLLFRKNFFVATLSSSMATVRCCGTTMSGQRCSITSLSSMRNSAGLCVADPLKKGGRHCMMHTVLFAREPAQACEPLIAYLDLETNSLDVLSGKIVEIGALVDFNSTGAN